MIEIAIDRLLDRRENANVMPDELFGKLTAHIKRTGRYPAIIVRPSPDCDERYEILDGHHRRRALAALGHATARCEVWDVDDAEALVLLATLNRLAGQDDILKRAALIEAIGQRLGKEQLPVLMPEDSERLERLLKLNLPLPAPVPAPSVDSMPEAVTFFLRGQARRRLNELLSTYDGTRSERLVKMLKLEDDATAGEGSA
jgi:hypothetical protein